MRRARKIGLWTIGVLAVAIAALVGAVFLTPSAFLARQIADAAEAQAGLTLAIDGPIERRLWPGPGLIFRDVAVAGAHGDAALLAAEEVAVEVSLSDLLAGRVVISDLTLSRPRLELLIDQGGDANFEIDPPRGVASETSAEFDLETALSGRIRSARIVEGSAAFFDARSERRAALDDVAGELIFPTADAALRIEASGRLDDKTATLSAEIENPIALLEGGDLDAALTFAAEGAAIDFDGQVAIVPGALPERIDGAVAIRLDAAARRAPWVEAALPTALAPLESLELTGRMDWRPAELDADLEGHALFNGERTELSLKVDAEAGGRDGARLAVVEFEVENPLARLSYVGQAGADAVGPALNGAYALRAPDLGAALRWSGQRFSGGALAALRAVAEGEAPIDRLDFSGEATLSANALRVTALGDIGYNGRLLTLEAQALGAEDWRDGGAIQTAFDIDAIGLGEATWKGALRVPPATDASAPAPSDVGPAALLAASPLAGLTLSGVFSIDSPDVVELRRWSGVRIFDEDYGRFALQGRARIGPEEISVTGAELILGEIIAAFDARYVEAAPRPKLTFEAIGKDVDLTPFVEASAGVAPDPAVMLDVDLATLAALDAVDLAGGLEAFDAEIAVTVDALTIGDLRFGAGLITGALVDGALDLSTAAFAFDQPQVLGGLRVAGIDGAARFTASRAGVGLGFTGSADVNGRRTAVTFEAEADAARYRAERLAVLDVALQNAEVDVGYRGAAGLTEIGGVLLDGAWRAKAADAQAVLAWLEIEPEPFAAHGNASLALLERFDVAGELAFLDASASGAIAGAVAYNAETVDIEATLSGGADWRAGGRLDSFVSIAQPGLGAFAWNGEVMFEAEGPRVEGEVLLATPDVTALRRWAGFALLQRDYGRFSFEGRVAAEADALRLEDARVELDQLATDVDVDVAFGETRPYVTAELRGGPFDITPFLTSEEAVRLDAPDDAPWSVAPFQLEGVRGVDGEIALRLDGVRVGFLDFGDVIVDATLREGRLAATLERIALYEGAAAGDLSVDASTPTLRVATNLRLEGVEMNPLLTAIGRADALEGDAALTLALVGAGANAQTFASSLDGSGRFEMRDGTLLAIDFAAMSLDVEAALLGARQRVPGETPFERFDANFRVRRGVMRTDDLTFRGPVISFRGEGEVDIGRQRIDFTVTPTRFGEISFFGIDRLIGRAFPVTVRGPLSNPQRVAERTREIRDPNFPTSR